VCQVSHSGYYRWNNKGRQVYEVACKARETLKERVLEAFEATTVASRHQGSQSRGIDVSMATVGRLMAELGIPGGKWSSQDYRRRGLIAMPERAWTFLKRNFTVHEVDALWVSDLTYIGTSGSTHLCSDRLESANSVLTALVCLPSGFRGSCWMKRRFSRSTTKMTRSTRQVGRSPRDLRPRGPLPHRSERGQGLDEGGRWMCQVWSRME